VVVLDREYGASSERSETWSGHHSESKRGVVSLVCPAEIPNQQYRFWGMWLRQSLHPILALAQRNLNQSGPFRQVKSTLGQASLPLRAAKLTGFSIGTFGRTLSVKQYASKTSTRRQGAPDSLPSKETAFPAHLPPISDCCFSHRRLYIPAVRRVIPPICRNSFASFVPW
jgi:hypothetical protein